MSLDRLLFGGKVPENEGFSKVYETVFNQGGSLTHKQSCQMIAITYDVNSEFFINPEKNIVYMVGRVQNRKISALTNIEIEDKSKKELKEQMDEIKSIDSQRIFAYSVCRDGTEILTGNLGIEALNDSLGGLALRILEELFIDGVILRNVRQRDVYKVLGSHKNYVRGLEIVSDSRLAEHFVERYKSLNSDIARISV